MKSKSSFLGLILLSLLTSSCSFGSIINESSSLTSSSQESSTEVSNSGESSSSINSNSGAYFINFSSNSYEGSLGEIIDLTPSIESPLTFSDNSYLSHIEDYSYLLVKEGTFNVSLEGDSSLNLEVTVNDNASDLLSLSVPTGLQVESSVPSSLTYVGAPVDSYELRIIEGFNKAEVIKENHLEGLEAGDIKLIAYYDGLYSSPLTYSVKEKAYVPESVTLSLPKDSIYVGEAFNAVVEVIPNATRFKPVISDIASSGTLSISSLELMGVDVGSAKIRASCQGIVSNVIDLRVLEPVDPYVGVSKSSFYSNYSPATSYYDATFRSQHGLLSGVDIYTQESYPDITNTRPTEDDTLLKNSSYVFSNGGKAYSLLDEYGDTVLTVYESGGYTSLLEIATYLFAFGKPPMNFVSVKERSDDPDLFDEMHDLWGQDLGTNDSYFSGNTTNFPYEPALPGASGNGGNLDYYEVDFRLDGYTSSRGIYRFVYTKQENDRDITNLDIRHVFYTNNHYNDFYEFLNYEGGFSDRFGNQTAGNNRDHYNPNNPPTSYIAPKLYDFENFAL